MTSPILGVGHGDNRIDERLPGSREKVVRSLKLTRYSCARIDCAMISLIVLLFSLLTVPVVAEGQTAEDREWAGAVSLAKAEGRTNVEQLLTDPSSKTTTWFVVEGEATNLACNGQPLNKLLVNKTSLGTNEVSLDALFTLKQIISGKEPELITYELPISYDVLTNMKPTDLGLSLDEAPGFDDLFVPTLRACKRATNGDCLLVWDTSYEQPGQHALQALLELFDFGGHRQYYVKGPVIPYFSSNLCRFFLSDSMFSDTVAFLDAGLPESNGVFSIEIKTLSGEHVKTLSGSTSNGMVKVDWDLIDEKGHKYTGDSFESFFTIKLPDSGRSQTLKKQQAKLKLRQNK